MPVAAPVPYGVAPPGSGRPDTGPYRLRKRMALMDTIKGGAPPSPCSRIISRNVVARGSSRRASGCRRSSNSRSNPLRIRNSTSFDRSAIFYSSLPGDEAPVPNEHCPSCDIGSLTAGRPRIVDAFGRGIVSGSNPCLRGQRASSLLESSTPQIQPREAVQKPGDGARRASLRRSGVGGAFSRASPVLSQGRDLPRLTVRL
jgi:hypothetical protein